MNFKRKQGNGGSRPIVALEIVTTIGDTSALHKFETNTKEKLISEDNMKLKVILEPSEEGGYTITVPSLPGCISEGESREEAIRNIREAIELYLEPVEDDQTFSPGAELMELAV